jgi:hypothetical protein
VVTLARDRKELGRSRGTAIDGDSRGRPRTPAVTCRRLERESSRQSRARRTATGQNADRAAARRSARGPGDVRGDGWLPDFVVEPPCGLALESCPPDPLDGTILGVERKRPVVLRNHRGVAYFAQSGFRRYFKESANATQSRSLVRDPVHLAFARVNLPELARVDARTSVEVSTAIGTCPLAAICFWPPTAT